MARYLVGIDVGGTFTDGLLWNAEDGTAFASKVLSTPDDPGRAFITAFDRLIDLTKLRWRIERDYQELKQELGLGDYEGRGWRGFHHHATLCIAAYGFLIAERGAVPPSGPPSSPQLSRSVIPEGCRPRGAADPTRTPHSKLDRHHATTPHRRSRQDPPAMPLLQRADPQDGKNSRLLTQ